MSTIEKQQTIELTYPCHTIDGTDFICSRALASELVADALKLLAPVHAGNMERLAIVFMIASGSAKIFASSLNRVGSPSLL
jgi:hypothetical protein